MKINLPKKNQIEGITTIIVLLFIFTLVIAFFPDLHSIPSTNN